MAQLSFIKTTSAEPASKYISEAITNKLRSGQNVLWLVPGGSAIEIAVQVGHRLMNRDLKNLTVSLTDERYGLLGHLDSNWQQLKDRGFSLSGANLQPVLAGKGFDATIKDFDKFLEQQLKLNDFKIGLFGMGADGHAAGILPDSPAVNSKSLAVGYDGPEYKRITMTPKAVAGLDEAVIFAAGQSKHEALDNLTNNLPIEAQPAQVLKQVPKLIVYNDYKGEG